MRLRTLALIVLLAGLFFCLGCQKEPCPAQPQAAAPAAAPAPANPPLEGKYKIPEIQPGKFNVAFVYVGPIGDGGWTYAQNQGRMNIEKDMPDVATAYIESVAEGADAEQTIRSLARKGFNLIIATSFGFMDACETVSKEFPNVKFLHVSGFKKNSTNFGNLFGSMEDMKYLAGMILGARAKEDKASKVGYIAPLPIPEVIRLINALALGMRTTCPNCALEVRWVNSWFDPVKEKEAAESLLNSGCDAIATGNDTSGPIVAAGKAGKWAMGYNSENACNADPQHCLTVPYWNWAASYERIVKEIKSGAWKPSDDYPEASEKSVGLLGFMEGQTPAPGVPKDVIPLVKAKLQQMQEGKFTRFDVFAGPLKDNKGNVVLKKGEKLVQEDLEGIKGVAGRPDCTKCMNFFVEGVIGEIPK